MTIWRWLRDLELVFPKPMYVRRRRFWVEDELDAWDEERGRRRAA